MKNSIKVANYFACKAREEHTGLHPLQLHKMVFIAHGWTWAYYDVPLLDEPIYAGAYGPMIKKLYKRLVNGKFLSNTIGVNAVVDKENINDIALSPKLHEILDSVYTNYKKMSGVQMSVVLRDAGAPWQQMKENEMLGLVIPETMIRDYYVACKEKYAT